MSAIELVREIFTVASLLIKFDAENILEDRLNGKKVFIEFLNEIGIKGLNGKALTQTGFATLMKSLSEDEKASLVEEFNEGFKAIYCRMAMHS
ncbi:anti-sigma factor [Serratia phage 92A1]|nr:anti-sigma factor [Serratia phage 92A1]